MVIRDHSLFIAGGGLVEMNGGGVTQNSRQFEGGGGVIENMPIGV